jgi:hypothetical protein
MSLPLFSLLPKSAELAFDRVTSIQLEEFVTESRGFAGATVQRRWEKVIGGRCGRWSRD